MMDKLISKEHVKEIINCLHVNKELQFEELKSVLRIDYNELDMIMLELLNLEIVLNNKDIYKLSDKGIYFKNILDNLDNLENNDYNSKFGANSSSNNEGFINMGVIKGNVNLYKF
ncbi:putative transcriptional regulator [Methanococcus voltae]|uniref:hypothetical protein n=1 Tax=Methanococcus voltae TaxID=2188 RepID=UPI001AE28429|nr:hypothetical protein [Methanococcus voltae]MBP2143918.1 putative transcriptional regulator [Methanococcus voltae]